MGGIMSVDPRDMTHYRQMIAAHTSGYVAVLAPQFEALLDGYEQLVGERDKFRDRAHRMMVPCQCDPLEAGEELCNGGCVLTYERDGARDLVVAIENHAAKLNAQIEALREELVVTAEAALAATNEYGMELRAVKEVKSETLKQLVSEWDSRNA